MNEKGFTLLELIIVIGIIAILGTVSVLVLNPAQLFAQARDTTRIADLSNLNSALSLYLTDVTSTNFQVGGDFTCGTNWGSSEIGGTPTKYVAASGAVAHSGVFVVSGTGWVAVNLGLTTGGSPLSTLPRDPSNTDTYNYQYSCDNGNKLFELDAKLESAKFTTAPTDKAGTDGGNGAAGVYEIGNSLTL